MRDMPSDSSAAPDEFARTTDTPCSVHARQPSRGSRALLFFVVAVSVTALDLWSKAAIFEFLSVESVGTPPRVLHPTSYAIIPNWFELEANYNYGAFSGWLSSHPEILTAVSALALFVIVGILVHQLRQPIRPGFFFTLALGLLWGGTCGNLYDRVKLGAVRDWIKWFYVSADGHPYVWPNFNIADSAICTGVGVFILQELLRTRSSRARKPFEQPAEAVTKTPD
jgi:signal peptidase II